MRRDKRKSEGKFSLEEYQEGSTVKIPSVPIAFLIRFTIPQKASL